jgi:hypothetical protein
MVVRQKNDTGLFGCMIGKGRPVLARRLNVLAGIRSLGESRRREDRAAAGIK